MDLHFQDFPEALRLKAASAGRLATGRVAAWAGPRGSLAQLSLAPVPKWSLARGPASNLAAESRHPEVYSEVYSEVLAIWAGGLATGRMAAWAGRQWEAWAVRQWGAWAVRRGSEAWVQVVAWKPVELALN